MSVLSSLVALAAVLVQGAIVFAFLKFVKSFGRYSEAQRQLTETLILTHQINLQLHQQNVKILERLTALHAPDAKEVA